MARDTSADEAPPSAESSVWRLVFEASLRRILAECEGTEAKVREGMESGMRKLFENPYHVELGALGGGKSEPLSVQDAQRVLFCPRLSDIRLYVAAFACDTSDSTCRRQKLMKFKMMSVFYTLHRKDGTIVDRFMHLGGLDSLVALVAEDNNVIQSQAVELLTEMLSPLMVSLKPSSSRQAHLHHQVFACFCSCAFWTNLARVLGEPHEIFPKSHASCVRILAGAVGWLRPEDDNNVPEVGAPSSVREVAQALQRFLAGSCAAPDVRGLAEDLLQELLDVPTIRGDPLPRQALTAVSGELSASEAHESAAHAWQALKQLGSEAFRAGLLWSAEAAYRLALDEGGTAVPPGEASLLHSNRALVLLRAGHTRAAAEASATALELDGRNAKAAYRRAQALLEQGDLQWAVAAAELAATLEPNDSKVADLLAKAMSRLGEAGRNNTVQSGVLEAMD